LQNIEGTQIKNLQITPTNHRLEFNHDFDWDNPIILDKEEKYYRKLISEMINIKSQNNKLTVKYRIFATIACRNPKQIKKIENLFAS